MAESTEQSNEYMAPALVEVGEFNEDTLGGWGNVPDWFFNMIY
ncbi:hypothetical protein DN069_29615 [Streptacidiphilus pinicola]|uniref:Lasso RiPP family leader peptide-containing protein n=1 Tax=Streptacidiphilus pinicola TaxID=2219663 RepID=A0A2X0IAT8_9ACTN|nr:lasso RiPP family leader peptide-containing protein [Streptacidiphilus pinicola]RAG82054.1 hypothetical protein DN069_29615 [Streptacidiphilus pinicola]